nr:ribonuclease H-like domain-containing protein [Tanacetum cinerariifolium]
MKYWITNNDMNIWKVIQNGNNLKRTGRDRDGRVIILPPTTAEEHITVQRESKARTTLIQSIPDNHVADFHYMDDARHIWNAVKARFGGNVKSKKVRKSMLKQEFLEFRIGKAEGLHKGYDRMQKILIALTLKTKGGLELLYFDDLYYKLKTLEVDVKGYTTFSSSQSAGPSHSVFVSATSASKKMSYGDSPNYSKEFGMIDACDTEDAIKEGAAKIYNLITKADTKEANTAGDAGEFALMGVTFERNSSKNLFKLIDSSMSVRTKVGSGFTNCIRKNELGWDDSAFSVFTTTSEDMECRPIFHRFAKTDSMKVVPPPLSGDYTSLSDHIDLDESQMSYGTKSSTSCDSKSVSNDFVSCDDSDKSSEVNTNDFASTEIKSNVGTPIKEPIIVQDLPSFTCNSSDKNKHTSRTSCNKNGYFNKKAAHFRKHASSVSKLCFVYGSGTHLIKDCDFYEKQMANKTVGIKVGPVYNKNKVNYQNQFVPQVVLLRTSKVHITPVRPQPIPTGKPKVTPVPTGKPKVTPVPTDGQLLLSPRQVVLGNHIEKVYTGYPRIIVDLIHLHTDDNVVDLLTKAFDGPRYVVPTGRIIVPTSRYVVPTGRVIVATGRYVVPAGNVIIVSTSRSGRIQVNTIKQHVNTAIHKNGVNVSNSKINTSHKSHSPIRRPFYKSTVHNTRISKELVNTVRINGVNTAGQTSVSTIEGNGVTANKALLTDYQDIDEGFVSFGGSTKGGKITSIGKIRTNKTDFEDVFFVKELKFNIFFISQMCDKKNNVLFTESKCLILSPDFKLIDESQVLLRVPRQNNMYSFDLKNVVLSGDLSCLFVKTIIDESNLWHRKLGHVNFKTMNKLVKGNLVRGLPSKTFENDHTYVACRMESNTKSLVNDKNNTSKGYHAVPPPYTGNFMPPKPDLVFTDKHVVSEYVTSLPDIANSEVKTSETKLKNVKFVKPTEHVKSPRKFVKKEGNNRQTKYARKNSQSSRGNVIDHISKDNGSYMLKRLNYVDIQGRLKHMTGNMSFLTDYQELDDGFIAFGGSPKGDHLGKFERKADEGFLVGYSVNSKAFRVFNTRTKKVEENLNIKFLENKPNVAGRGIEIHDNAVQAGQVKASDHEYILLPFMPSSTQNSDDKDDDEVPGK